MVLMALDHTRHFLSNELSVGATNMEQTNAALFLTRWITHFCAPVFVLLAGTGAFLATTGPRGKTRPELAWFLLTRGLWLIVLELTFVRCAGWTFNLDYHYVMAGVLWALGWSMIVLAGLIYLRLPLAAIAGFGIVLVVGHDAFDAVKPGAFGAFAWLWKVLHTSRQLEPLDGVHFKIAYPLIPWIGVMALGYAMGAIFLRPPGERRKILVLLGAALCIAFVVLRATRLYGDPRPWEVQDSGLFTVLSFINTDKYPPSLLFLLMTLGPAMLALAAVDFAPATVKRPFIVFGRVPLFFYLLHIPLIHLIALVLAHVRYGDAHFLLENPPSAHGPPFPLSDGYGYNLLFVYAIWIGVTLVLYPACRWFAEIKQHRRSRFLSYL